MRMCVCVRVCVHLAEPAQEAGALILLLQLWPLHHEERGEEEEQLAGYGESLCQYRY
jgi:hypothetical protein